MEKGEAERKDVKDGGKMVRTKGQGSRPEGKVVRGRLKETEREGSWAH